jgi:hypothetical protein
MRYRVNTIRLQYKDGVDIMNCDKFDFSPTVSHKRILQARAIFGETIVNKILAWVLFLLGASKPTVCSALDFKPGTLRTLLYRVQNQGLGALEDRRYKTSTFKPQAALIVPAEPVIVALHERDDCYQVNFGDSLHIQIPLSNPLLFKSLLLCLLQNQIINRRQAAQALQLSEDRVGKLAKKLVEEDVTGLIDQRRGQKQDYIFTPTIKGELIQQVVIDIVQDGKMSGEKLSKHLNERCQYDLSPRSILYHLRNMGLSKIKKTLPAYLAEAKKNSSIS